MIRWIIALPSTCLRPAFDLPPASPPAGLARRAAALVKRLLGALLIGAVGAAGSGVAMANDSTGRTLVVGSEQDYPPFSVGQTDATAGGFTVDLWRAKAG